MVLPKDLRDRAKIGAGDKPALTSFQRDREVYCIMVTKAAELSELVLQSIGPAMKVVLEIGAAPKDGDILSQDES